MKKPDLDYIKGLCPAIAIEQKVSTRNARSTVGSLTEIYDFLRLLYARIGKTISPVSGNQVQKQTVTQMSWITLLNFEDGTKAKLRIPLQQKYSRTIRKELGLLLQKGFTRVTVGGEMNRIEDLLGEEKMDLNVPIADWKGSEISVLIDRFVIKHDNEDHKMRIADSTLTCI